MSAFQVIAGSASVEIESPDWAALIPDKGKSKAGSNAQWREMAAREWVRIMAALREAGTLAPENRHQMQRLIIAYVRYDRAAAEVFRLGLITEAARSGVAQMNIYQSEMRHADADATTAEMELGITPRRRAAVGKSKRGSKVGSAADAYLKRTGG